MRQWHKINKRTAQKFVTGSTLALVAFLGATSGFADTDDKEFKPYTGRKPFVAEPYVPPPPPEPKVHMTDHGDGTLTDDKGLMWTYKDSYADLGQCLNWYDSAEYVEQLTTGGYKDWRLPTVWELYGIYDDTRENVISWDHDPNNPLHLPGEFADGAAYWYWTGPKDDTELTDCCAVSFYFVTGLSLVRQLSTCMNGGVRAVRNTR